MVASRQRVPTVSEPEGSVRIVDVARAAGVSVSTVSKALNGRVDVSAGTRARIRAIADELGFHPNALARSLPTGRSFSVGLLTTDSYGRFSIPIMLGAEDALGTGDVAVVFCDTRDDPVREHRQVQALRSRRVDGIIVNGRRSEPRPPLTGSAGIPVVYAFARSTDPADCSVVPDDPGGAGLAVDHLLTSGRRAVAHITGPRRHRSAAVRARATSARLRRDGFTVAGGIRYGSWSEAWGRAAVGDLLDSAPRVDAVFCGSDQIARGVLDGLIESGRRVPDDVAIVGFDNWAPMALGARPELTTIDMNMDRIGTVAATQLLSAIDGLPTTGVTVVPATLVVRGSAP